MLQWHQDHELVCTVMKSSGLRHLCSDDAPQVFAMQINDAFCFERSLCHRGCMYQSNLHEIGSALSTSLSIC